MAVLSTPEHYRLSIGFIEGNPNCLCLLISNIFLWEFECNLLENVGLLAGRYSGTKRPDLYLTPQALQSVLGPSGPALHCGVLSAPQCWHFLPIVLQRFPFAVAFEVFTFLWTRQFFSWSLRSLHLRRRLDLAFTGILTLPKQYITTFPLAKVSELWCFVAVPKTSTNDVSTAGNASLFDNHSSSSSANSCKW